MLELKYCKLGDPNFNIQEPQTPIRQTPKIMKLKDIKKLTSAYIGVRLSYMSS